MFKIFVLVFSSLFSILTLLNTRRSRTEAALQQRPDLSPETRGLIPNSQMESKQSPAQEDIIASDTTGLLTSPSMQSQLLQKLSDRISSDLLGQVSSGYRNDRPIAERKSMLKRTLPLEDELESFELELIKKSRYDSVRGEVLYEIKWRGYPDTENTWEPRENLLPDCLTDLLTYHYLLGSTQLQHQWIPQRSRRSRSRTETQRGSDLVQRVVTPQNIDGHVSTLLEILRTDWEREVDVIESINPSESGESIATVKMKGGKRRLLSTEWLALHCPRQMLRFLERTIKP